MSNQPYAHSSTATHCSGSDVDNALSSQSSSSTPPPTQQDVVRNLGQGPLPVPSFEEFALQNTPMAAPASLNPDESILSTEIQEITPEEFSQSIEIAARSAQEILALKLPRSCKRVAEDLAASLTRSKRRWQETGIIPADEDIKISELTRSPASTSNKVITSRKRSTRKRGPKGSSVKPVNLLIKPPTASNPGITDQSAPPYPAGLPANSSRNESSTISDPSARSLPATSLATNNSQTPASQSATIPTATGASPRPDPRHSTTPAGIDSTPAEIGSVPKSSDALLHPTAPDDASLGKTKSQHLFHPPSPDPDPGASGSTSCQKESTNSHNNATDNQSRNSTPPPSSPKVTIILSDAIRLQVVTIHNTFTGTKPSWPKYQTTWESLIPLIHNRAQAMHPPSPPLVQSHFHLQRAQCSYGSWIQTIAALAGQFLSPSHNEQWYCPDVIDFPKLTSFGDKDSERRPGSFIPPITKTPHPESTLVRGLYRLLHPPQRLHNEWARLVAASVEMMAENLFIPPQVSSHPTDNNHITRGLEALSFLNAVKQSSSSIEPADNNDDPSSTPVQRLHSVDVLDDFRNVVIDVLMAYIIFQTHYLSESPLTPAQKKANNRANQLSSHSDRDTSAVVQQDPSDLTTPRLDASQSLQKFQRKQNYQPLVYFALAGVRGLFITSRDHRIAGISTCMSFIQAMHIVRKHSTTAHTPEEPIWKNLSAYLFQVFLPVFQSPEKICPLAQVKVPTRFELAKAIANDFINQWQAWNPTSPFLLPHPAPQIAGPAP
ncbi:hypothetical protein PTTG_03680 [Puccinia triticina 1-1 BBBD Race 1]|uniref:Uncharacterized protein n=1 Tax=Puccinia triticina (isolate 1-1 / race 1 (BBBD)) TaxID=630390 RepID=A0A180GMH3_PUCT1|nr:hypothetical protein PTTG_03680 [Puccinia triticina 1-1 BBBD Race 1]WAR53765.1 hypothetical protein PtB15_3B274 [Puccinia triticina]